jgi:hypothetical protein
LSFVFIILLHKKERGEKMRLEKMRSNSKVQSCDIRAERARASDVDYYSELEAWVQHVLLEAERNQDSKKSAQFQSLLKEL